MESLPSIYIEFPDYASAGLCTPASTSNYFYCFYDKINDHTYRRRDTFVLVGDKLLRSRYEINNYGYDTSAYLDQTILGRLEIYPELSHFWFPLISCIMVSIIFILIYKIIFKRFIK